MTPPAKQLLHAHTPVALVWQHSPAQLQTRTGSISSATKCSCFHQQQYVCAARLRGLWRCARAQWLHQHTMQCQKVPSGSCSRSHTLAVAALS